MEAGTGAIDIYYFENVETGELRYNPSSEFAKLPNKGELSGGGDDHYVPPVNPWIVYDNDGFCTKDDGFQADGFAFGGVGVSKELRAALGDPTRDQMRQWGALAWDDEFYRIYFGMSIKIWQVRRWAALRRNAQRQGFTTVQDDEHAFTVFDDNDKDRDGLLDSAEQSGTAFGVGRAGQVMMRFMDIDMDAKISKAEWVRFDAVFVLF